MTIPQQRRKWYQIKWFADHDTKEDRQLILRLDLLIVPYAFLTYWTKYLDHAYVSGMKEELNLGGNDLVHLQTIYTVGAVVDQVPFIFLFTKIPMFWLIPFMDVAWAAYYPAMHYIFGSWYRGDEISRRGGCFYVGNTLGSMTASLIQAGASARLDGVNGLAGWRWMYIICAIITIPIAIAGFFVLPGTPDKPNKLILKEDDIQRAKIRLESAAHKVDEGKFSWAMLLRAGRQWKFWARLWLNIIFWNASTNTTAGGYSLWLKSLNRYSTSHLNDLAAIAPGLGIFYTLFICFTSDLIYGPAWAITVCNTWNIIGSIILVIWNVLESALWFAFFTVYVSLAQSSILYGWINTQLRASPVERATTLVIANMIAQSTTVWTPLLVFKTVDEPPKEKGLPVEEITA
ncbi:hypothetical protein N7493_005545 [Penicillium malachiteum]|uniref:Major facilitator superfamily (MFS) profile domain-containing protein n=1 Tax=Penicillium malachiteum TaxID=1324776 RepID=A0AAD6MWL9_9EURO|nr:hypothetical protein N7493_005545 [Penicillium malachiteum]